MAHLSIIDGITPQGLLEGLVHVPQGLAQDGSRLFPDKSSSPDLLRCDVGPNFLSIVVPAFSALFNTFLSAEILHFPPLSETLEPPQRCYSSRSGSWRQSPPASATPKGRSSTAVPQTDGKVWYLRIIIHTHT